ncbi:MAG: Type secretion system protein, partial [Acidobacteriota bacterium]|nr:Type secretion system protein [Acidobacteriota bacterium]
DLIEEVRGPSAEAVVQQATPLDDTEVAATPVPLPLVILLVVLALASLVTSVKNPLNGFRPLTGGISSMTATRKAISLQRIEAIGQALEKYNDVHVRLPADLKELAPHYLDASLLKDPWGNAYKYLQPANRYLVIGFTRDGKPDTDLFLSRAVGGPAGPAATQVETGGITLIE